MSRWDQALFDTSSLITLDHLLLDRPSLAKHFSTVLAIEASFTLDSMIDERAARLRKLVRLIEVPSNREFDRATTAVRMPASLAKVDRMVLGVGIHHGLGVVTGDRRLARAVQQAGLDVLDMATALKELVESGSLTPKECEQVLVDLATREDFIIGTTAPTWDRLRKYRFPPD